MATVLITLVVANYAHWMLSHFPPYNRLHRRYPWYFVELLDKILVLGLILVALYLIYRTGPLSLFRHVRLQAGLFRATALSVVAIVPMLVGFMATRKFSPESGIFGLAFMDAISPMVEEIHARGLGFWQLRRGGWPFWAATAPQALLSGLGHIEKAANWQEVAGIVVLIVSGAVIFSWLLERWQTLWAPFLLHASMNTIWDVYSVSGTVLGGWFPFAIQQCTMLIAIAVTLKCTLRGTPLTSSSCRMSFARE